MHVCNRPARLPAHSEKLHRYIIDELIRNGMDRCVEAMKRLLSGRERRANMDRMADGASRKRFRRTAISHLDLLVANLYNEVDEIDARVTSLRKEVDEMCQSAMEGRGVGGEEDDDSRGHMSAPDVGDDDRFSRRRYRRRRRDAAGEDDWDRHPHASRKRKSTPSGERPSLRLGARKRRRRDGPGRTAGADRRPGADAGERLSAQTECAQEADDLLPASAAAELDDGTNLELVDAELDDSPNLESVEVEFVGETDDFDDHRRSVLPPGAGGGGAGRAVSRRGGAQRPQHSYASYRRAAPRGGPQQWRPMSATLEGWLVKQTSDDAGGESEAAEAFCRRNVGRPSSNGMRGQNRQAPSRTGNSAARVPSNSRRTASQDLWSHRADNASSRAHRARGSNGQPNTAPRLGGDISRSRNARSNSNRQGGVPRSKNNSAARSTGETASSTRPSIPDDLSAEILFDALSLRKGVNAVADGENEMHSHHNKPLGELCRILKNSHPSQTQFCGEVLTALRAWVSSRTEVHKDEVVMLFGSLLSVFGRKCTTLLDIIQTRPEVALFQIDCWCLVFRALEKKWNSKLGQEDGTLYKIFGRHVALANHVLLQVIDALYSQLLWEEYGKTPVFEPDVFDRLRYLCVQIGMVVRLLPTVCGLLTDKLDRQRWHLSLTNEQKENEIEKVLFVSAIDPRMQKLLISSGEFSAPASDGSRIRSFKHMIRREEIDAIWSIMGFFSCCVNTTLSVPELKQPQNLTGLLSAILHYDCGALPRTDSLLPPSKQQVETCSREIKWVCTLVFSKMLGDLPNLDSFVDQIIKKAVMLESFEEVLVLLPNAPPAKVNKAVKQMWKYSCITSSSEKLESDLQGGLMTLDTLFLADSTNSSYCLMPSSILLRRCVSLAATYATMVMKKKLRWKGFRAVLLSLASKFWQKALELEAKDSNAAAEKKANVAAGKTNMDAFAEMFQSIEAATTNQVVMSPTGSHFREAACYLMLAGIVARSRYNVPGEGNNFHLNEAFRETIWKYSSDEKMYCHRKHYLDRMPGDAPASSSNICLLYTSAKVMTFMTMLHLHVSDFKSDSQQITESLRAHILAVKMDVSANMMEYLFTAIFSSLLACCEVMDTLNQRGRVSEQEEKCKAHLDCSKSCLDVISTIAMWLNLAFGRATFILELIAKAAPSCNELVQLSQAIKRLGRSSFFHFIMQSLTEALAVIVETASRHTFSKGLSNEGCLERALRGCLGAIRNSIALVHACGADVSPEMQSTQSNKDWVSAVKNYLLFVTTKVMPSIFCRNGYDERWKLCRSQSGGVLSILAALCSISQAQPGLRDVFDIFRPNPEQNADGNYLQQMGLCFSCELAQLARHNRSCNILARRNADMLLKCLICSLVDADTLAMFPTGNFSLLSELDGLNSRSKGNDLLSKSQVHRNETCQDPDQEAYKIKRLSGDYFDTAGPSYNVHCLWSFCENVGQVLIQFDDTKYSLQMWPVIKSIGKDIVDSCKRIHSDKDLLEMLPQVSIERECLKRIVVFQTVFNALKRDNGRCFDTITGKDGGLSQVLSVSIMENLYYLSGIELELEEQRRIGCNDSETRYERAKSFAFRRAYTELCGLLMTLLLRENIHWENKRLRDVVRHGFIVPALKGNLDIRSTIEGAAANANVNLCLRVSHSKGSLNYMTRDLSMSFFRRTGELLVYGAGCHSGDCHSDSFGSLLFNSMLHAASVSRLSDQSSVESVITAVGCRLIFTPEAIGVSAPMVVHQNHVHSSIASDGLQSAIDDYLLCAEVLGSNVRDEQKSILSMREWAMDRLFVLLLQSNDTAPQLRAVTVKLLTCMIKKYSSGSIVSSQKILNGSGNLANIGTYSKLFHSLKECLCNSLRSNSLDAAFVTDFFSCAHHFLTLPMSMGNAASASRERETLLSWACSPPTYSTDSDLNLAHLAYIFEISKWLSACGKLLRNQASATALGVFLAKVNENEGPQNYSLEMKETTNPVLRQLCSSFSSLTNLEHMLSLGKINRTQSSNPYAGKSSSKAGCAIENLVSIESLQAIEEFGNFLACHGS